MSTLDTACIPYNDSSHMIDDDDEENEIFLPNNESILNSPAPAPAPAPNSVMEEEEARWSESKFFPNVLEEVESCDNKENSNNITSTCTPIGGWKKRIFGSSVSVKARASEIENKLPSAPYDLLGEEIPQAASPVKSSNQTSNVGCSSNNRISLASSASSPSSLLSPEPTIDLGALGKSLGISSQYNLKEDAPTYSESEFQLKLAAAVESHQESRVTEALQKASLEHEASMKKIQDEHACEIDEMIKSLDALEKDYEAKLVQKDAIISAVGAQVVEFNALKENNKKLEEQLKSQNERLASEMISMEQMVKQHRAQLEEESVKRLKAVEKMKSDMRRAAEEQFAEANKHYLKLKYDYKIALEENKKISRELRGKMNLTETNESNWKAKEASLNAQIAKLKAEQADLELGKASEAKQYLGQINSLRAKNQVLIAEVDELKDNVSVANSNLSSLRGSVINLTKENEELKNICEELMQTLEQSQS